MSPKGCLISQKLLPGMRTDGWDPESALKDNLPPLASLSHNKVMCFFSLEVSFGMFNWLVRFNACSLELLDKHVRKRWDNAASTDSSQPWWQRNTVVRIGLLCSIESSQTKIPSDTINNKAFIAKSTRQIRSINSYISIRNPKWLCTDSDFLYRTIDF